MSQGKRTVIVQGREIGGNDPLICTPLIGMNTEQILTELKKILPKMPDLIEWRADFFESLHDTEAVLHSASKIREAAGNIPILFTIRSHKEGGQSIAIEEQAKIQLIHDVCKSNQVDLLDYELSNEPEDIQYIRQVSREYGVYLVLSYHNFGATPEQSYIVEKLREAKTHGADIAKVAVMPTSTEDVLILLNATHDAKKVLQIPIVTMSMGGLGAITRMAGCFFGSDITFAIGEKSSAPGQIPIEDLRSTIQIMQKSMGNG